MKTYTSESKYWIKGFLKGNQPNPPSDNNGEVDFESKEYQTWQKAIGLFDNTGYWWSGDKRFCDNCNEELLDSEPEDNCKNCRNT